MIKTTAVLIGAITVFFTGCSAINGFFSVGEQVSYCKEFGCDYTNVGVCAGPIEILENKNDLSVIKKRNEAQRKAAGK
jgi:hypothetical protein